MDDVDLVAWPLVVVPIALWPVLGSYRGFPIDVERLVALLGVLFVGALDAAICPEAISLF